MSERDEKRFQLCCHIAGRLACVWGNGFAQAVERMRYAEAVVLFADAILNQLDKEAAHDELDKSSVEDNKICLACHQDEHLKAIPITRGEQADIEHTCGVVTGPFDSFPSIK